MPWTRRVARPVSKPRAWVGLLAPWLTAAAARIAISRGLRDPWLDLGRSGARVAMITTTITTNSLKRSRAKLQNHGSGRLTSL